MTAPVLGVDPGRTGGACLLGSDGRRALATWRWAPSGDGYELWAAYAVWQGADDGARWLRSLAGVGEAIAAGARGQLVEDLALCCEGLFVPPGRAHGVLELAEATGELLGPLRALSEAEPLRPRASTWRPAVLSIPPNTPADRAEAVAVHAVRLGLVRGLPELVDRHVAEACCIARWGWVAAQRAGQLELAGRR